MEKLQPRAAVLGFRLFWIGILSLVAGGGTAAAATTPEITLSPVVAFFAVFTLLATLLAPYTWLYFNSITYTLTESHVSKSSGVIWKKKRSIPYAKITNIDVRQGPIERLLGFGQIWIFTPSTGAIAPEETLIGITDPHVLKEKIEQYASAAHAPSVKGPPRDEKEAGTNELLPLLAEIRDTLHRIEEKLTKS